MMTKQTKLILAITLQVVIILGLVIFKLSVLTGGTEVLLRIVPVDPRDFLRGDYVTFQYDISNLDSYSLREQQIKNGDAVYIILRQTEKYWTAENVQKNKPIENELFIKGKIENGGLDSSRLHILYGIEQYFIPEGKGQNFSFWDKESFAIVAVDDNGNAVLKKIYVDDKPWP